MTWYLESEICKIASPGSDDCQHVKLVRQSICNPWAELQSSQRLPPCTLVNLIIH